MSYGTEVVDLLKVNIRDLAHAGHTPQSTLIAIKPRTHLFSITFVGSDHSVITAIVLSCICYCYIIIIISHIFIKL